MLSGLFFDKVEDHLGSLESLNFKSCAFFSKLGNFFFIINIEIGKKEFMFL